MFNTTDKHRIVRVSTGGHHATVFVKSHPSSLPHFAGSTPAGVALRPPAIAHCRLTARTCAHLSINIRINIDISLYNASDLYASPVLNTAIVRRVFNAVMNCVVTILLTIIESGNDDKRFDISTHLLSNYLVHKNTHTHTHTLTHARCIH